MSRVKKRKRELEFVEALVRHATDVLKAAGLAEQAARDAGNDIARRLCTEFASTSMYVPSSMQWDITDRDNKVWAAYEQPGPDGTRPFSRDRVDQLAREFHMSPQYVYTIIRLVKDRHQADRQMQFEGLDLDEQTT